jgi:putative restriction endonuclease
VSIYVYPTDARWFHFLRKRAPLDEVNFWQPGGSHVFTGLKPGGLFLFRLKAPVNKIAGGGVFAHASLFPLNAAWDAFREKNGVGSFAEFWQAIEGYRRRNEGEVLREDSRIGCIILQSPWFLDERDWIPVPEDYHANLVQGKRFPLESDTGARLFRWASSQVRSSSSSVVSESVQGSVFGDPVLVKRRLGQGTFRILVSDAYSRRCAVTGEKTLPVLEAAHIKPVSKGGEHRVDNGLLLRSDLHTLFDLGYVTVTRDAEFRVSSKLKETWMNGRVYYALDRSPVQLPEHEALRPSALLLEWHSDVVFRA